MITIRNCSVDEFRRMLEAGKKVVCVGGGSNLQTLCRIYEKLAECLVCVLDNAKIGTTTIEDHDIPIKSPVEFKWEDHPVFVISSILYADEIIGQLDALPDYDGAEFYIPELFTITDGSAARLELSEKRLIPKTIHFCWFGGSEIPQKFQKNIETWRKYCPDYEIVQWDESNYDVSKNRYMRQAYEKRMWGFVSDYARLDVVNQHGGIYLDTDVEMLRSFDGLLGYRLFCGFQNERQINFGLGFGAQSGHPVLEELLKLYEALPFIHEDGSLNLTPCPVYQTQVLENYGLVKNGRTQITPDFTALSVEYLSPINMFGVGQPTSRSFSVHQYAVTWGSRIQRENHARIVRNCQSILRRLK